jgi:polyribonucleotide 5'-hydroxyl-kinase
MVSYINVHAVLERRRQRAQEAVGPSTPPLPVPNPQQLDSSSPAGPRVIVVGPTDSGKSSLARMLLGWAARLGWKPTYVDLDIGQGAITIPGTIAATPIEMPIHPIEGIPLDLPLVYFYGHTTPSMNPELYKVLVKELARTLEIQFAANPGVRAAGMVINTMGWVDGVGYEVVA